MTEVIEYQGKKWKVVAEPRDDIPTGKWLEIVPVPELPEEPAVGTILVDDDNRPLLVVDDYGRGDVYLESVDPQGRKRLETWEQALRRSDLRQVVVVGKATDSVVRFNGVSNDERSFARYLTTDDGGHDCYWYQGHSDDEAPVHGYFRKVVE